MTISIATNVGALSAQRNIGINAGDSASSIAKLSSGLRVPTAKDDAAALAIGSRLNSEVNGLRQASLNAGQGSSLLQIADGAMGQISDIIVRMQALAVQSASGTLSATERTILQSEFSELQTEIDRIATDTKFNGVSLLAGGSSASTNVNDLSSSSAYLVDNQIGADAGIAAINFSDANGDGVVRLDYNGTTRVLTLTNLLDGTAQSQTLSADAIAVGATETYAFGDIGAEVVLDDRFNKATSINSTQTASNVIADIDDADLSVAETGASALVVNTTSVAINSTATAESGLALKAEDLVGLSLVDTPADASTFTFDDLVVAITEPDGTTTNSTFRQVGFSDLDTTGAQTVVMADDNGNRFTVSFNVATTANDGAAISLDITGAAPVGAVEAASISISDVDFATAEADRFDFGDVDDATIVFDLAAANNAAASVTLNGVVFNTANYTGGGDATPDLTATGSKTVILEDANANRISIDFNVTTVFNNSDELTLEVSDFGRLVGSENASGSKNFSFQVGTGVTASEDRVSVTLNDITASVLGIGSSDIQITGSDATNANAAITALATAVDTLNTARATVGAAQNRLDFAANAINVAAENNEAARSGLLDVDVSTEMTMFTSKQVLIQAGVSILAQANQQPALLLRLLQ